MDPNANLKEQAQIVARLPPHGRNGDPVRLAELRHALAAWINGGGFAPTWSKYPTAARAYLLWTDAAS